MKKLSTFRLIGFLEGISFLFLTCIAMPLKYVFHRPLTVHVAGMAHGILFIAYIILLLIIKNELNWKPSTTAAGMLAAVLPFGTFIFDKKVLSKVNTN